MLSSSRIRNWIALNLEGMKEESYMFLGFAIICEIYLNVCNYFDNTIAIGQDINVKCIQTVTF